MSARSLKIRITVGHEDATSTTARKAPASRPLPTQPAANNTADTTRQPILYAVAAIIVSAIVGVIYWSGGEAEKPVPVASTAPSPIAPVQNAVEPVAHPAVNAPAVTAAPTLAPAAATVDAADKAATTQRLAEVTRSDARGTQNSTPSKTAATPKPAAATNHAAVARAVLTHGIDKREPIDQLGRVVTAQPTPTSLVFFTEIRGMKGHTLRHRWSHNGTPVSTVPLKIGSDNYRVYSTKSFQPDAKGSWQVVVLDEAGTALRTFDFVYE